MGPGGIALLLAPAGLAGVVGPVDEGTRPPGHVRASAVQPSSLAELEQERPVRVWWDAQGPAQVEATIRNRWVVVAEQALPGVEVGPFPPTVRLRVRHPGGAPSEPISPVWGLSPSAVARLAAPVALPGVEVADLAATGTGAWGAVLDGGLVQVNRSSFEVRTLGAAEGVPGSVNAVIADDGGLWVGTSAGLLRIEEGRVVRLWDAQDGLPDDWVQALHMDDGTLWAGTYRGLVRLEDDRPRTVLGPWSVFWIGDGPDQRSWAGYAGLHGLPEGEPIEGMDPELNVWDVDHFAPRTYVATDSAGLLLLQDGRLQTWWMPPGQAVDALARSGGLLYAAAHEDGLVAISESGAVARRYDLAAGLPSLTAYEVVAGPPGRLWVGTDRGLALLDVTREQGVAWPLSPLAAGLPVQAVLGEQDYALVGGSERLVVLGRPPRAWRDAAALPGPVVALRQQGRSLWVIGSEQVWRVRRRSLERWDLPVRVEHAATVGGTLWVGGEQGLWRHDGGQDRFVRGPVGESVLAMAEGGAVAWVATPTRIVAVDSAGSTRDYVRAGRPRDLLAEGGVVWVATASGVERLDVGSGEVEGVEGIEVGVRSLARDSRGLLALLDTGQVVGLPTLLPVAGLPLPVYDPDSELHVDAADRLWVLGPRGATLLVE